MADTDPIQLAAEALVATVGLFHDAELTRDEGAEAEGLPKAWRAEVVALLDQTKPRRFKAPKVPDHAKTLDALAAGVDVRDARDLVAGLARPELAEAVIGVLTRARSYLFDRWPRLSQDTLTGPRTLPVGRMAMGQAAALYAVLDDPSHALVEMRSGTLTGEQADALREVYPSLYRMLTAVIWEEATKRWPPDGRAGVPWRAERIVRVLVGLRPDVSLSQAAPPPAPKPAAVHVDFAERLQTRAQRLSSQ